MAIVISEMAAAAPAPTITKSQIRSDPKGETDRRLKDVVWSLFEKQDLRGKKAPTQRLSSLFLRTKIQATHVPALYRYDNVRIEFEPVNAGEKGPDAPTRPVGLTSTSYFAFLSAPPADYDEARRDRAEPEGRCSRLPKDQRFFTARDEREAAEGYRAWIALRESIRAGRKFPLECDLMPVESRPCEAIIAAYAPDQLSEVETCEAEPGILCHALYVDDRLIKVLTTGHIYPGPKAGQVVSAKLDSLIVMRHAVVD
jgi:hypothetical protein